MKPVFLYIFRGGIMLNMVEFSKNAWAPLRTCPSQIHSSSRTYSAVRGNIPTGHRTRRGFITKKCASAAKASCQRKWHCCYLSPFMYTLCTYVLHEFIHLNVMKFILPLTKALKGSFVKIIVLGELYYSTFVII